MIMKEVGSVLIPGEEISVWVGKCYSIGFEFDVIKLLGMCERARLLCPGRFPTQVVVCVQILITTRDILVGC